MCLLGAVYDWLVVKGDVCVVAGQVKPGPGGSVEMVASRDIRAEEDLLLSYGKLDNTFLLLDYGAAQRTPESLEKTAYHMRPLERDLRIWLRTRCKASASCVMQWG